LLDVLYKYGVKINFTVKPTVLFRLSGDLLLFLQQKRSKQENAVPGHLPAKSSGFPKML